MGPCWYVPKGCTRLGWTMKRQANGTRDTRESSTRSRTKRLTTAEPEGWQTPNERCDGQLSLSTTRPGKLLGSKPGRGRATCEAISSRAGRVPAHRARPAAGKPEGVLRRSCTQRRKISLVLIVCMRHDMIVDSQDTSRPLRESTGGVEHARLSWALSPSRVIGANGGRPAAQRSHCTAVVRRGKGRSAAVSNL